MENTATSSAHTPGPWHIEPTPTAQFIVQLEDGSTIATVGEGTHEGGSMEELEANARLIAAAPELLEACEVACEVLRELSHHPMFRETSYTLVEGKEAICQLASIIAKATGQAA